MSLEVIQKEYKEGKIDKWQYIDNMYAIHDSLFNYSDFIRHTNISKIEIDDEAFNRLYGHISHPIEIKKKGQKIAVRIISQFGE